MIKTYLIASAIAAIAILILVLLFRRWLRKTRIKAAGNRGEKTTRKALKSVRGLTIYENIHLSGNDLSPPNAGKNAHGEIDHVAISQAGIFAVETKNHSGRITGRCNDSTWQRIKTSKAGNNYESTLKNPTPQARRSAKILTRILKKQVNYTGPIVPVICIAGCEKLDLRGDCEIPICTVDQLAGGLKEVSDRRISMSDIKSLCDFIESHGYKKK